MNATAKTGAGTFAIPLSGVTLDSGHYWVSVRVRASFPTVGQWGWEITSYQNFTGANFRNPKNGELSGCTKWAPIGSCYGGNSLPGTDLMFSLAGTETPTG